MGLVESIIQEERIRLVLINKSLHLIQKIECHLFILPTGTPPPFENRFWGCRYERVVVSLRPSQFQHLRLVRGRRLAFEVFVIVHIQRIVLSKPATLPFFRYTRWALCPGGCHHAGIAEAHVIHTRTDLLVSNLYVHAPCPGCHFPPRL